MSAFGKGEEIKEGSAVKLYTGVENFRVVAVNPSKEEMEKMYDRELNFTPEYVGTTKVTDSDGEREVNQIRLDFFLANEDNSITTKVQFYVADTHHIAPVLDVQAALPLVAVSVRAVAVARAVERVDQAQILVLQASLRRLRIDAVDGALAPDDQPYRGA